MTDVVAGTANGQAGAGGNLPDIAVGAADQGPGDRTVPALELSWREIR